MNQRRKRARRRIEVCVCGHPKRRHDVTISTTHIPGIRLMAHPQPDKI